MNDPGYEKTFQDVDFTDQSLDSKEYTRCIFRNCNFANFDLTNIEFMDTQFENCNLSMVRMANTQLKDIRFNNCKMIGIDFSVCNCFLLAVGFEKCILDYTNFHKLKLKNTIFRDCIIKESNFTNSDLNGSVFEKCDLQRTIFSGTNLNNVDFVTSFNFIIDPELNFVKKAKFSYLGLAGLLNKYDISIE